MRLKKVNARIKAIKSVARTPNSLTQKTIDEARQGKGLAQAITTLKRL